MKNKHHKLVEKKHYPFSSSPFFSFKSTKATKADAKNLSELVTGIQAQRRLNNEEQRPLNCEDFKNYGTAPTIG